MDLTNPITLLSLLILANIAIALVLDAIVSFVIRTKASSFSENFKRHLPLMSCIGGVLIVIIAAIIWLAINLTSGPVSFDYVFMTLFLEVLYCFLAYRFTTWLTKERLSRDDKRRIAEYKAKHQFDWEKGKLELRSDANSEDAKEMMDTLIDSDDINDYYEFAKQRGLLAYAKEKPIVLDYQKLAEKVFDISANLMYDYGKLLQSGKISAPGSIRYLQDTTGAGTSLYVYAMVKIRQYLKKAATSETNFEKQDSEMVKVFSDKLMESPSSLTRKMEFTTAHISEYTDMMKELGLVSYIEKINNTISDFKSPSNVGSHPKSSTLRDKHRGLLKKLSPLEVRAAKDYNDMICREAGLKTYDKISMDACAYAGLHFGYYCLLKASETLKDKLTTDRYAIEKGRLLELFVKQHRNICTSRDLDLIFSKETSSSWRRQLEKVWTTTTCLDEADKIIEDNYANT